MLRSHKAAACISASPIFARRFARIIYPYKLLGSRELPVKQSWKFSVNHCNGVIMGTMASQITGVFIVCSIVGSGTDQRKHQSSASLAFVRGIHRRPVNSPHRRPVTWKTFPFDDVIMLTSTKPQQNTIKREPYVLDILWPESTATEILCWRNLRHWLHWKLSKWQLPVRPLAKFSSLQHFLFCEDKP